MKMSTAGGSRPAARNTGVAQVRMVFSISVSRMIGTSAATETAGCSAKDTVITKRISERSMRCSMVDDPGGSWKGSDARRWRQFAALAAIVVWLAACGSTDE